MAANEIHLNDIGTIFEITLKDGANVVDISTATTKEIIFKMPAGTILTKAADFTTDGTDGKIQYVAVAGFLSALGQWTLQAHIILGSSSPISGEWRSDMDTFECHANL